MAAALAAPARAQTSAVPAAPPAASDQAATIADPWEGSNRGLYRFSMNVDRAVIAPVVHGYIHVVPHPVRTAIRNVVNNLDEPRVAGNDILQGHLKHAGEAGARFVVNSTLGLGGLLDSMANAGIRRHDSDFGQTLGRYGAGTGPYVFVPFIGPANIRDGIGRIVDAVGDPVGWATGGLNTTFGQVRAGVDVLQARVDVDDELTGLERDFTDPYATLRSAYAQNRTFKVQEAKGVAGAPAVEDLPDFGTEPVPAPAKPSATKPAAPPHS